MTEPWWNGMTEPEALIRWRQLLMERISKMQYEVEKINNRIAFLRLNSKDAALIH